MFFIFDVFAIEKLKNNQKRVILKLDKKMLCKKLYFFCLLKKFILKLQKKFMKNFYPKIFQHFMIKLVQSENVIEKQDAIRTPSILTIIDETAKENKVTIRF